MSWTVIEIAAYVLLLLLLIRYREAVGRAVFEVFGKAVYETFAVVGGAVARFLRL